MDMSCHICYGLVPRTNNNNNNQLTISNNLCCILSLNITNNTSNGDILLYS